MQIIRKLLWPFALIYGLITFLRNKCYDLGVFSVYQIPKKSICIGNLSTGGTGKTPHVAYLAAYLSSSMETSILSRGYGRKTSGFILLNENSTTNEVGDEPLFYYKNFKDKIHIAVCERRKVGVQNLQKLFPSNELILLDDAFQHRAVRAGLNVLLTEYNLPFSKDHVLPMGNLREYRSGKKRADCVIVTKCPVSLSESQKNEFAKDLNIPTEKLFFSKIIYGEFRCFGKPVKKIKNILLVTGIANPKPLLEYLECNFTVEHIRFKDHHLFTEKDIFQIHQKIDTFASDETILLTTEKDYMRLMDNVSNWKMEEYPWYYQPISIEIDNNFEFKKLIDKYVNTI